MKQYFVHIYHVVRSKVSIEAEDHQDAMRKADECIPNIDSSHVPFEAESQFQGHGTVHHTESAEEVVGYLVDEVGDEEYSKTLSYEEDYSPSPSGEGRKHYLAGRERDTILAALRVFDAWRCGEPIDREMIVDIETNGGKHPSPGLSAPELDALCERINS